MGIYLSLIPSVSLWCVCLCVQKVYCGKTAGCIPMPFGVVSGVGREMAELDGHPRACRGRGGIGSFRSHFG